jgi:hypothetical protein
MACSYFFADGSRYEGIWDGSMQSARFSGPYAAPLTCHCYDPSNASRISTDPLLADPYESQYSYVGNCTLQSETEKQRNQRSAMQQKDYLQSVTSLRM